MVLEHVLREQPVVFHEGVTMAGVCPPTLKCLRSGMVGSGPGLLGGVVLRLAMSPHARMHEDVLTGV